MIMMISLVLSILRSWWTRLDDAKPHTSNKPNSSSYPASTDFRRLAEPSDAVYLPVIEYAYDPLPALPAHLKKRLLRLPSGATAKNSFLSLNSVHLDPLSAGLPYRCSIDHVYASKFWEANLGETMTLLNMLAVDDSASDIEVDHGITVAKLARKALRPGVEHRMVLATHYMFPYADELRIKQISALMLIYFVFDGGCSFARSSHDL